MTPCWFKPVHILEFPTKAKVSDEYDEYQLTFLFRNRLKKPNKC